MNSLLDLLEQIHLAKSGLQAQVEIIYRDSRHGKVYHLLLVEKDEKGNSYNYLYSDRLLSRTGPQGSIYYHQDGLGSTTALSDISGKILNRYEYDAFGQPRSLHGKIDNQILFAGEMYDPSGLIYLRARYYDPVVGRFLTEDTLPGELDDPLSQNLYLYCANNPVVYVDPTGHKVCKGDETDKGVSTLWDDFRRIPQTVSNACSDSWNDPDIRQSAKNTFVAVVARSPVGPVRTVYNWIPGTPKLKGDEATEDAITKTSIVRLGSPSTAIKVDEWTKWLTSLLR